MLTENKSNYLNKDIPYLNNVVIYEYDMSSGGFNILRSKKVFNEDEEELLLKMDKLDRNVYIGKKLRKQKGLSELLINGFKECMIEFCKLNNIEDSMILSIKKDALFVINHKCTNLKLNEYITFKEANKYTTYMYVNEIEFYYNTHKLDVKGLSDEVINNNEFYNVIKKIMQLLDKNNDMYLFKYLKKLQRDYLDLELDKGYYKEFNINNTYRLNLLNNKFYYDEIDEDMIYHIDIRYNYMNYILPIIQMLV